MFNHKIYDIFVLVKNFIYPVNPADTSRVYTVRIVSVFPEKDYRFGVRRVPAGQSAAFVQEYQDSEKFSKWRSSSRFSDDGNGRTGIGRVI